MLAFITSLRHPDNSASYDRVEALLEETLASVTGQTIDDYVVIVVGNRRPAFELPPRVHFVPVDFPAPAPPTGPRTARAPFVWDKGTKIGIGLIAARDFEPDHVMIFDADDFVSNRLAAFSRSSPQGIGWFVDEGWMFSSARNAYRPISGFNRTCGTCYVIPFHAYGVPEDLDVRASQQDVANGFGERLNSILGAHREAVGWFDDHGVQMRPFPFRAAVYHVDTGENHSGKALTGIARPLSTTMRAEFALPPRAGRPATLWRSFGPAAIWGSMRNLARRALRKAQRIVGRGA